jgi:uncharacterized protein YggE
MDKNAKLSVALLLTFLMQLSSCYAATSNATQILTVNGQGSVSIPTSQAIVTLGVEVQEPTAQQAQQAAAERANNVIQVLQSRGVSDLETVRVSLFPVRGQTGNITAFTAVQTVQFRAPPDQVGDIIDSAVEAGASTIDSISFVASDEQFREGQRQAIQLALEDAQQQASFTFNRLGLQQQEIVGIRVNAPPSAIPLRATAQNAALSTPILPGEQDVTANVALDIAF